MAATMLEPASDTLNSAQTASATAAQQAWAATPIARRVAVLRAARHELARIADRLVDAISRNLHRTRADSYAAEVLPLLAACRFLENEAATLLKPRRLGRKGLPFWLVGIDSTIERVPFGTILIIAPGNYPLFLPGVQTLQALAAGNAVIWKPGSEGQPVAEVFLAGLERVGLPPTLLRVTNDSSEAAITEIAAHPDKIVFTGSSEAGRAVLRRAADMAIPVVAELSGCDAVVVLESADTQRVLEALTFGMHLNGSATCMAPRRLFLVGSGHEPLIADLQARVATMDAVELSPRTHTQLQALVADAELGGATTVGNHGALDLKPLLILNATPAMAIARADIFAPILSVIAVPTPEAVLRADEDCPFGLTAAIFGEERAARELGARLTVGTVLINDLIVPTADPRVPFGGRRGSGFGTTRGAEGLLEMTAAKVTSVRTDKSTRHYQATGPAHEDLFRGALKMSHSATLIDRFKGLRRMIAAAKNLK